MNPAFSTPQLRTFLPLFRRSAIKVSHTASLTETVLSIRFQMCGFLKDEARGSKSNEQLIYINKLLSRTTLDVIGEGMLLDQPCRCCSYLLYAQPHFTMT